MSKRLQTTRFAEASARRANYKLQTSNAGFSLVETLTAIFAFSVIMLLVGGVFVYALNIQRKAFNLQQAEENAGIILETMAKEIRTGQITTADTDCPASPASSLSIVHPVNGNIIYSLAGTAVHRNVNGQDSIMSSNTVNFTNLQFCVSGSAAGDGKQPKVTILTGVMSAGALQQAAIYAQMTISQRTLSN